MRQLQPREVSKLAQRRTASQHPLCFQPTLSSLAWGSSHSPVDSGAQAPPDERDYIQYY